MRDVITLLSRFIDTVAAGANVLQIGCDRRKAALPRLFRILDGQGSCTDLHELFGAAWAFALGFWLLVPFDTFATTPTFRVLAAISIEGLWGAALFAFGLWRFDAILMNRRDTNHALTMAAVVLWGSLAVLFFLGNPAAPGAALFMLLATLESLSYRNQEVSS
jgi:hypothetical protein